MPEPTTAERATRNQNERIADWIRQRGVLFLLLQAPIAALLVGFLFRRTTLPIANYGTYVAFALLVVWVSWRLVVSTDPDEPARHLHRYAGFALLPLAVFGLFRVPLFFTDGIVYWQLWYAFGTQLTGEPSTQIGSLAAGMVMYTLQGMVLLMGYFVLFGRHSLANALLFLGMILPALFVYLLPVFSLPGQSIGLRWIVVHWAAHLAMALAAWAAPAFWRTAWQASPNGRRLALAFGMVVACIAPYTFAFDRATRWQFGEQHRLDTAAFGRTTVDLDRRTAGVTIDDDGSVLYTFTLNLDRSRYTNAAGSLRMVDAGPIDVVGEVVADGSVLAWCTGHHAGLEGPNAIPDPKLFAAKIGRTAPVVVAVSCKGSVDRLVPACRTPHSMRWSVRAVLSGDRTTEARRFEGTASVRPRLGDGIECTSDPG